MGDSAERDIRFEVVWKKQVPSLKEDIMAFWKRNAPELGQHTLEERIDQCAIAVRTPENELIGISTAFDVYVERLKHRFYAVRLMLDEKHRIPGLMSTLMVKTRDHLESIHKTDPPPAGECVGLITIVENQRLQKYRNEAVWPASGMVYIGNTPKGFPIRIYYFQGARI